MCNCIIVDDQIEAIQVIEMHIKKIPQLKLVKRFTNSIEALDFLKDSEIDLLFLDVEMPDLSGFEFIDSLNKSSLYKIPSLILTTGYSEYALQGYEYRIVDFLLKPITFKRFKNAVDNFFESKTQVSQNSNSNREYFFIESDGSKIKINYNEVIYVESDNNGFKLVEKNIIRNINKPLYYIEDILCNHVDFVKVHKSYIISLKHVESAKSTDLILKIGAAKKTISIGPTFKDNFLKKINHR
jgi:DNA-binding LytR/AlgR family response regulator